MYIHTFVHSFIILCLSVFQFDPSSVPQFSAISCPAMSVIHKEIYYVTIQVQFTGLGELGSVENNSL
jgi:hypothetical protein